MGVKIATREAYGKTLAKFQNLLKLLTLKKFVQKGL